MLNKIKKNYSNTIIYDEANRSLELINLKRLKLKLLKNILSHF